MTEEKEVKKETQNEELDLNLLSSAERAIVQKYIAMTKYVIQNLKPIFPKLSEITDLSAISSIINSIVIQAQREIERSEQKNQNHFNNGENNKKNNMNPVNIESLVNALSFKTSKNGKSEFASIDKDLGAKLPQSFEYGGYNYYNKGDALIRVKKTPKQKNAQKQ
jgi:hypothetical protein